MAPVTAVDMDIDDPSSMEGGRREDKDQTNAHTKAGGCVGN